MRKLSPVCLFQLFSLWNLFEAAWFGSSPPGAAGTKARQGFGTGQGNEETEFRTEWSLQGPTKGGISPLRILQETENISLNLYP